MAHFLAIDQGTTSSRVLAFSLNPGEPARILGVGQVELPQHFPQDGWVEHDASEIWAHTQQAMAEALKAAGLKPSSITSIGITNQRETTVLWARTTGKPVHRAIVWQDRRTADMCRDLVEAGHEADLQKRTGLLADPYFSATKLLWLLDHVPNGAVRAARGELA